MKVITNQTFDAERALYGVDEVTLENCKFDGPADGESALKEGKNIVAQNCYFNLRYPFWHDDSVIIEGSHMTELCRAALWYSTDISIKNSKLHGIKALRECQNINIDSCNIASVEFGWFCDDIKLTNSKVAGEYFALKSSNLHLNNVEFKGKYSFQYITNSVVENCNLDTKDAFWHAKNVVVKNCVVKGEYLGWYAENLTFENCTIIGTQPLCYCKGLKLINCKMEGCDLAFERSEVHADIHSHVESIKNVNSGFVSVDSVGEVIVDEPFAQGTVIVRLQN